jgi:hypothetical protein
MVSYTNTTFTSVVARLYITCLQCKLVENNVTYRKCSSLLKIRVFSTHPVYEMYIVTHLMMTEEWRGLHKDVYCV